MNELMEIFRCSAKIHQLLIPNKIRKKVNRVNLAFIFTLNEKSMQSAQTGSCKKIICLQDIQP